MNFSGRTEIIRKVQSILGLDADGIDGPLTWQAIAQRIERPGSSPAAPPATGPLPPQASTFDARTEKNLLSLDPKAVPAFRRFIIAAKAAAAARGLEYVAISGNRTWAEQDALYARGRTAPGEIVTNAKGGQSNHNFGIALDFGVFRAGRYLDGGTPEEQKEAMDFHRRVSDLAKAEGIEWGGDWSRFKDFPHFEIYTSLSTTQKRDLYARTGSVLR